MSTTIELKIDEKARSYARIYASMISDEYQRKRTNAAITALFSYISMLNKSHAVEIQNSMTLYRNPALCEQYELADFYVNDYHIDVRVTVDDNIVLVPKIHYENNIVPDFYVVVKMDKSLKSAKFLGIVDTSKAKYQPSDFHYYMFISSEFISNEEFIKRVKDKKLKKTVIKEHEQFEENYLAFTDNEISNEQKVEILQHLFNCSECRTEFCCFTGFEMVNRNASHYPEIFEDNTLDIVGANSVNSDNYSGKEDKIYIGDNTDNSSEIIKNNESEILPLFDYNDKNEETDLLDELFSDDDDVSDENQEKDLNTLEIIEDEQNTNIQNVILDYDEDNKPVYSYMTNTQESEPTENKMDTVEEIGEENTEKNYSEIQDISECNSDIDNEIMLSSEDLLENEQPAYSYDLQQDETDILDQMFVDGALEREAMEQQEISYVPLKPVDNNQFDAKPSEENTDETDLLNNITEEPEKTVTINDEENTTPEEIEEKNNVDIEEEDITMNDKEEKLSETTEEEQPQKQEVDELFNALPQDKNETSTQLFDEYIESEISKTESEDEEDEEDEDEEEYYDEYEDDYEEREDEMGYGNSKKSSFKKLIITVCIIAFILMAFGASALFYIKNKKSSENAVENHSDITVQDVLDDENNDVSDLPAETIVENPYIDITDTETNSIPVKKLTEEELNNKGDYKDINKAITKALAQGENLIVLRGINWFCSADLYNDKAFKAYMQNLDNTLKQNLKNNIFGITEIPPQNEVTAKFAVDNERNLRKVLITESSGSSEIDEIVLQSINETFEGEKSPILTDSPVKSEMYYFKVVIKF